jgi:outer membrane protein assembly factor BamB
VSVLATAEANEGRPSAVQPAAVRQLQAADELAARGEWEEALTAYVSLIETAGTSLAPHPDEPGLYVPVRWLCQERLAGAPPAVLARYRRRVDGRAARWLAEGRAARDPRLLWRVADEARLSSAAPEALDMLGDLLFEEGRFAEAHFAWGQITRCDDSDRAARVRAKQLLACLLRGRAGEFEDGLHAFTAQYPNAAGTLAGQTGKYAEILAQLRPLLGERPLPEEAWTTYAGNPSRNSTLPRLPADLAGRRRLPAPRWSVPLGAAGRSAGGLRLHPLLVGDHVLLTDGQTVLALDADTGKRAAWHVVPTALPFPSPGDRVHTLTAADGRLFACLTDDPEAPPAASWLVCLDLHARGRLLWKVAGASLGEPAARFEGAPVVLGSKVYVAVTTVQAETVVEVACYHARDGALLWRQEVCRGKGKGRRFDHLLTHAGRFIVYSTQLGVLAALDADTGQPGWAAVYPTRDVRHEPFRGDPNPCLAADGLLFVAPADHGRLRCHEAMTGRLLWETAAMPVASQLGVAGDRLIVSTPTDLRAVDIKTGAVRWRQPYQGTLAPAGRGMLAGETVLWPTRAGLRALDARTGEQVLDPQLFANVPAGHLVLAGERLVVVTADRVLLCEPTTRKEIAP